MLRPFTLDDFDAATSLWQTTEGVGLNESDTREAIAAYLVRNPGLSLVAEIDSQIVAAVLCGHDGRRGFLNHLAVARSHRGRGLGRRLVEACLERLGSLGIPKCNIYLYADNDAGAAFWRHLGWHDRAELKVMQRATVRGEE
jgi:putative acetyltransferase